MTASTLADPDRQQFVKGLSAGASSHLGILLETSIAAVQLQAQLFNAVRLSKRDEHGSSGEPEEQWAHDEELLQLQVQVTEMQAEAAEQRRTVPALLEERLKQLLKDTSPTNALAEGDVNQLWEGDAISSAILNPDATALESKLAATLTRFPQLRAEVTTAISKLQHNVAAAEVEAAAVQHEEPDLAVLSPALNQALLSGRVVTRRRAAGRLAALSMPYRCDFPATP